jgi:hypothetical protein
VTWNVLLRIVGLIICVMAPLVYFGGLHPATGFIGGLVFLPTGWILADLFWLGIGLVVATFLPRGGLLKTAIVMAVYCVSALPVALIKTSPMQPEVEVRTLENGLQRFSRDEPITIVTGIQPRQFAVGRNLPRESPPSPGSSRNASTGPGRSAQTIPPTLARTSGPLERARSFS